MLKHKITSIIMGALVLSGVVAGGSAINNVKTTNDNTKVVNKVLLAAPSSIAGERAVVVNTDNSPLVLYSKASSNSSITSYISVGEMLTIQSSGDNFYKVKVQETGAVGYISAHNLQIITSGVNQPYNTVNQQGYIINVSSRVNIRASATMNSEILNTITNNIKVNVLGKQGDWYKVECCGTIGYIYEEYIALIPGSKVTKSNDFNGQIVYTNPSLVTYLRSEPNSKSNKICSFNKKQVTLTVLSTIDESTLGLNSWYKVKTSSGLVGYIRQDTTYVGETIYVGSGREISILKYPNSSSVVIDSIDSNTDPLYVIKTVSNIYTDRDTCIAPYYEVCTANGIIGFISNAQLYSKKNNSKMTESINSKDISQVSSNINNKIISNKPQIKWVLNKNENTVANSVVIENSTGKPIPNSQLAEYIKNWTLNYLINYSMTIAPTLWVPEFFNAVPDKDLVQAFINANGEKALSQNITAGELFKANTALMKLVSQGPQLLSDKQILNYIYSIVPKKIITRIVKTRYDYLIYAKVRGQEVFYDYIDIYTGFMNG